MSPMVRADDGSSMTDPVLESVITCPACGASSAQAMPIDACVFFHACEACGVTMRPKPGDCCVFCSYGSVPCPPVQGRKGCCD
jgi:hypothetical protein